MRVSKSNTASHRPAKLYFYADRDSVERAFQSGAFRLRPATPGAAPNTPQASQILPFGPSKSLASVGFLTLSLSTALRIPADENCIVIHDTEEFGERLHRAVQQALPQWAGIDAAVVYGAVSPLGSLFSKARHLSPQQEWLFAWRPMQASLALNPLQVQIGSLADFAALREPQSTAPR
jgi:hypothetical protein